MIWITPMRFAVVQTAVVGQNDNERARRGDAIHRSMCCVVDDALAGLNGNAADAAARCDTLLAAGGVDVIHGGGDRELLQGLGANDGVFRGKGDILAGNGCDSANDSIFWRAA